VQEFQQQKEKTMLEFYVNNTAAVDNEPQTLCICRASCFKKP